MYNDIKDYLYSACDNNCDKQLDFSFVKEKEEYFDFNREIRLYYWKVYVINNQVYHYCASCYRELFWNGI